MLEVKKEMEVRREVMYTSFPAPVHAQLVIVTKTGQGPGNEAEVYM